MNATLHAKRWWQTPFRDLVRGRVTGRLDWRGRIRASDLSQEVRALVERVVRRTRLWRIEKAGVADELVAHFADGLASGESPENLIRDFGDERQAAKLIRRAKKRNRSLAWHALKWARRGLGVLVVLYAIVFARYWFGRPNVSVDYVARLNAPILATPESDRAWPLYRKAIIALDLVKDEDAPPATTRAFAENPLVRPLERNPDGYHVLADATPADPEWPELIAWLDAHADGFALAREAAARPALGFVLGSDGSAVDAELGYTKASASDSNLIDGSLINLMMPHLNSRRSLANLLAADARVSLLRNDGERAAADIAAILDMGRQRYVPLLVTELVNFGISSLGFQTIERALAASPERFSEAQLVALAHRVGTYGGDAPVSLIDVAGERMLFYDYIQRTFSDDGRGGGHITAAGARVVTGNAASPSAVGVISFSEVLGTAAAGGLSAFTSRRETVGEYDRLMDLAINRWSKPLRETSDPAVPPSAFARRNEQIFGMNFSFLRHGNLLALVPAINRIGEGAEKLLGRRDGVAVGIALELYRRRNGEYPASLDALAPNLLPKVPADRITGEPVKYRLIDGRPMVYSVGVDRDDDAGRPVMTKNGPNVWDAAEWPDGPVPTTPRVDGDWILFDARPAEAVSGR